MSTATTPTLIVQRTALACEVLPTHPTGEVLHPPVRAQRGYAAAQALRQYVELCDAAGYTDPHHVAEALERSRNLRRIPVDQLTGEAAVTPAEVAAIAAGDLDPRELEPRVADEHTRRVARIRKDAAKRAANELLLDAARRLHRHSDQFVADLAAICDHSLDVSADRDATRDDLATAEDQWTGATRLLAHLRHHGALPAARGAARTMYLFDNATAVHRWLCDHAPSVRTVTWTDEDTDERHYRSHRPVNPPPITAAIAAEHRDAWGYRIRTAEELAAAWRNATGSDTPPEAA